MDEKVDLKELAQQVFDLEGEGRFDEANLLTEDLLADEVDALNEILFNLEFPDEE